MLFVNVLVALAAAGFATAQTADIPPCVLTCVTTAATEAGCADMSDTACICTSEPFVTSATSCIQGTCTADDLAAAMALQSQLCPAAGSSGAEPSGAASTPVPSASSSAASGASGASTSAGSSTRAPRPSSSGLAGSASVSGSGGEPKESAKSSATTVQAALVPIAFAALAALALLCGNRGGICGCATTF